MEQTNTTPANPSAGKGLGIAGLILGIVAAIISFIPCLGTFALIPGIIGIILSAISMVQANKAGAAKGMAIAGLICSIVGCCLAGYQMVLLKKAGSEINKGLQELKESGALDSLNNTLQDLKKLEEAMDTTQSH